jgi:capsular polysaccharide transport system permease protein
MNELKSRDRDKDDILDLSPRPREESRSLALPQWLRPLARAAPTAMKEIVGRVESIASAPQAVAAPFGAIPPVLLSFLAFVIAPSLAVTLYFAFIASDQYYAETQFAVRSVETDSQSQLDGAGDGASPSPSPLNFAFTAAGQNTYIVTSYIRSRAIVDDISAKINLRKIFRRPEADFWARLKRNASVDELTDYWQSMVQAYADTTSGIVTVRLRAFRPEDALALAKAVVETSEALVNRVSDRARRDATAMAEKDLRRAFANVQAALAELHKFRDSVGIIDPGQTLTELGKLLGPLMAEKIRLESELFVATREMTEDAPSVRVLREKLAIAEAHIKDLKAKITSEKGESGTLAGSLAKFEELEIQRQLAERLYTLAQADLDRAQMRANRQNIYLSVFAPPSLPQESRYPRRVAFSFLAFFAFGIIWSIIAMIVASVDDHRI